MARRAPRPVLICIVVVVVTVLVITLRKSPADVKAQSVLIEWNLQGNQLMDAAGKPLIKNAAETIQRPGGPWDASIECVPANRTVVYRCDALGPGIEHPRFRPDRVCPSVASHPLLSWSLHATGDGVLYKQSTGPVEGGLFLPVGIFLTTMVHRKWTVRWATRTTLTAPVRSLWGCGVFVTFTLLPAPAEAVRVVLAQCADTPAPGTGVRAAGVDPDPAVEPASRRAPRRRAQVWVAGRGAGGVDRAAPPRASWGTAAMPIGSVTTGVTHVCGFQYNADGSVLYASNGTVDTVAAPPVAGTLGGPPTGAPLTSVVRCIRHRAPRPVGGMKAADPPSVGNCIIHKIQVFNGWISKEEMRAMYLNNGGPTK